MTRRTEGTGHAVLGANQHPRGGAHRAGNNHRLTDLLILWRQPGRARTESTRRAFAMDTDLNLFPIDFMCLELAHVVRNVIDLVQVPVVCEGQMSLRRHAAPNEP